MKGSIMMDLGGNNMTLQKKGMHGAWASRWTFIMAATGSDLMTKRHVLEDAWREHDKITKKEGYMLPISLSASPPIKDMTP